MAKTKISELEKMVGADRKEIIAFLNENGVDAKNAASSVDEDAVKLVRNKFARETVSADKPRTPVKVVVKKVVSAAGRTAAPAQPAGSAAAQQPAQGAPVKKRKVIIVKGGNAAPGQNRTSNYVSGVTKPPVSENSQREQGRNQAGRNQAAKNSTQGAQGVYRPIKPKTVPTQMTVDFHKPVQTPSHVAKPAEPEAEAVKENVQNIPAPAPAEEVKTEAIKAAAVPETDNVSVQEKVQAAPAAEAAPAKTEETPAEASPAVSSTEEKVVKEEPAAQQEVKKEEAPAQPAAEAAPAVSREQAPAPADDSQKPENNKAAAAKETAPAEKQQPAANVRKDQPSGQTAPGAAKEAAKEPAKEPVRPFITRPTGPRIIGNIRMNTNPTAPAGTAAGRPQSGNSGDRRNQQGQGRSQQGQGRGQQGARTGAPSQGRDGGRRIRMNDAPSRGTDNTGRFGSRPGQGPAQGARGGAQASGGFGGDSGKNAGRRNQNQARDKRGRKDFAMEEMNERRSKPGRFIKPAAAPKAEPEEQIKVITIPEKLTIRDLAEKMHMQPAEIIKKLFLAGKVTTVNTEVTYEEAENIAADYEILCEKEEKVDVIEQLLKEEEDSEETLKDRAPVICVMGHVDHGKTSLLDYIRKTKVTAREAGGITQAIGAYTVDVNGRMITFLDTPGHEAFTAMRMRGAQSTDIAVLVVAADDGVMPQTVEAINHAKAAGVEIVVAVNKIDKPDANPDRVKQQLAEYGLQSTDWGGSTEFVNVSAKTGEGIEDLLETILLTADVMELKANPDRNARGLVLEAKLDKGRGPVANVLVQKGTLHVGDFISAGAASGKVRAMINDRNEQVKTAGPSTPVVVLGLNDVPGAGEVILAHDDDKTAKSYAQTYKTQHKEELLEENKMSMNVEDLFDQMREGKLKQLDLIVKADVQGSVEALCASLLKLSNDEVMVKIIHSAAGNITESDVSLASASNAAIIGFNVKPDSTAASIAEHSGVSIHLYKVIYEAIDAVDAALKGMLAPVYEEKVIGHAEVRQIFKSGKIGNIAGSYVLDGQIERGCMVRITRGKDQIFEGALASLKRFKDDVKEVKAGYECGLVFEDFDDMNVEDIVEAYKMVEVPREELAKREAARKD